jgi:Cys-tRNA(Pro)/Cys-tRNA(Cys) deacylase
MKTNAARILDELGIAYELREYPLTDDTTAAVVAEHIGISLGQLFKTLLAKGNRHGECLAVVPADAGLDLKALARAGGNRKATLVPLRDVEPLTGYVRGGVTALGTKRAFPVYLDEAALEHDRISVSAGRPGAQILLAPRDYVRATGATVTRIRRS